ncbi:DUF2523 domain-containing protein [Nitrosomonas europaea]|uniref:Putative phage protein n=1 Tax=Nitrosomonas europaea (strain ATCC 19718 / CIP 103999 / KCTC 2705 / NBRC 14298) TaxID=228410 RepID=Q82W07_NITEU|nr:DUF2523 domain-containing protein [Nitrosomonas europaea]CAD84803.1 putative phage gene [Nitrosomonas europaea ATCC 19718]SDW17343.1 Protein of unknown function [Nitrosomonas europaea]SJZ33936.1 Protein of unknown function [Nitrosomonas europaea]
MNILIPLGAFLEAAAGPLAVRVLTSLGIGVISYAGLTVSVGAALTYMQTQYFGLPSSVANLANLAGLGQCLGIVTAAITFRVAFQVQRKTLGVLNK